MELLFLSVTTLTTTGFSDVVPLLVVARIGALLARRGGARVHEE
ncbi:hypothetical protein DT076_13980 [Desertihabitans brevis]|uniref:Potassium channel domain-containing protein n=1 Tax=Desertihabitans brevis TaxID=2268447 RepID=A0A367YS27_9ACTN|nr:hypothetical protein DT076_13980 [Desertihabitans brevis]